MIFLKLVLMSVIGFMPAQADENAHVSTHCVQYGDHMDCKTSIDRPNCLFLENIAASICHKFGYSQMIIDPDGHLVDQGGCGNESNGKSYLYYRCQD